MTRTSPVAKRYGNALFQAAQAQNAIDDVANDMSNLTNTIDSSVELANTLTARIIARPTLQNVINELVKLISPHQTTVAFLQLLVTRRRLSYLRQICKEYSQLLKKHRNIETAYLTAAHKLEKPFLDLIKDVLSSKRGTTIDIEYKIQPDLLGGLIVEIGSYKFDSSLKTKLTDLKLGLERLS